MKTIFKDHIHIFTDIIYICVYNPFTVYLLKKSMQVEFRKMLSVNLNVLQCWNTYSDLQEDMRNRICLFSLVQEIIHYKLSKYLVSLRGNSARNTFSPTRLHVKRGNKALLNICGSYGTAESCKEYAQAPFHLILSFLVLHKLGVLKKIKTYLLFLHTKFLQKRCFF